MTHSNRASEPTSRDEWYEWGEGRDWEYGVMVYARPFVDAVQRVAKVCDWAVVELAPPWITIRGIDADGILRTEVQKRCGVGDREDAARVGVHLDDLADAVPDRYRQYPVRPPDDVEGATESIIADNMEAFYRHRDLLAIELAYNTLAYEQETVFRIVDIDEEDSAEQSVSGHRPESLPDGINGQISHTSASAALRAEELVEQLDYICSLPGINVSLLIDDEGLRADAQKFVEHGTTRRVSTASSGTAQEHYSRDHLVEIIRTLPSGEPVLVQFEEAHPVTVAAKDTTFTLAPVLPEIGNVPLAKFASKQAEAKSENRSLEEFL